MGPEAFARIVHCFIGFLEFPSSLACLFSKAHPVDKITDGMATIFPSDNYVRFQHFRSSFLVDEIFSFRCTSLPSHTSLLPFHARKRCGRTHFAVRVSVK